MPIRFQSDRPVRSQAYQYLMNEISVDREFYETFTNEQSIYSRMSAGFSYDERVLELQDNLYAYFWIFAEKILTPKQWKIFNMYRLGMTQIEIAKAIGINQSSVVKTLTGSPCKGKIHGGAVKKLREAILDDAFIQETCRQIKELRE